MLELTMYNIRKHYGEHSVLHDAGFQLYEGDRAGMVGVNGCGKSTILKLLAGMEQMDVDYRKICEGRGRIIITKGASIAYLDQIPSYPKDYSVKDVLDTAFEELYKMEEQLVVLENGMQHLQGDSLEAALKQYSKIQQDYDTKGGYERDEKYSRVCTGLKFDEAFLQKEFEIISGGEKTAVMLGRILLEGPDILLLDEPTNHLDMDAVEWLEGYLKSYRGIVIIVSHDRYFLDRVVSKIIEVESKKCELYKGNYSEYVKQKEENMLLQYERYKEQNKQIDSLEKAIKDIRDWAQRANNERLFKRAASMQKRLDRMDKVDKPVFERKNIKVDFKATKRSGYEIIKLENLSKSFGNRVILKDAGLFVTIGERVALIGPNGSGKTTLVKMLLGEINSDSGKVTLGASLKTAYLPQNISFGNEEDTVIDCFREGKLIQEGKAREYLAKFLFFGRDPYKKVNQLSGGEKVRLKLALLLYYEINLLILDEPTNHLDIDSIEALEEALEDFEGTILFISHDRYFINKICSRIVALESNSLKSFDGNYDFYKSKKTEASQPLEQPGNNRKRKEIKEAPAAPKKENEVDRAKLEIDINTLEEELREIDRSMLAKGNDYTELNRLYTQREELGSKLDDMLGMWLESRR